jgi:hypothetical protein
MKLTVIKLCTVCSTEYKTYSNRSMYCSKLCKNKGMFKIAQSKLIESGIEGIDYVIDMWNGYATKRIYGAWMRSMHPGKTTQDYLADFLNAPLTCELDKKATSKNSGLHMKQDKYRKLASDAIKGKNNPNHSSNVSVEVRQSRSPFSSNFAKYTDESDRNTFVSSIDWSARITSTELVWWLNKGYSLEEATKLHKERQRTFTLEKCIERHGEHKGTEIFNQRNKEWSAKLREHFLINGDGRSLSSRFAVSLINSICQELEIDMPTKEKYIYDTENSRAYSYDFTLDNKIIEFNGDYWHCNPTIYEASYFNKSLNMTAFDKWEYDLGKMQTAERYGYDILVIWESEWVKSPNDTLKKCIDFLSK